PKVCSRVPWQSHYAFPLRPPPTPSLFPYTTLFRSDLEAGRIRGHQEATDALCVPLLATVAGIGQHVAGHMEPRGPHLFTVDQPAVDTIALLAHRRGLHPGGVGAVGFLGEATAPEHPALQQRRHVLGLLLTGTETPP